MIPQSLIDQYVEGVLVLRREYEFPTFWLGTRTTGMTSAEEAIALKNEINRRVGEAVERLAPHLEAKLTGAVIRIHLHYPQGAVSIMRVRSLLVYGRYCKFARDIPQSRWPCRSCGGVGCTTCGGTGRRFRTSVEELVAAPLLGRCGATATKLHSVGREDVDARTLGRGRPFVLECLQPRLRTLDLRAIEEQVNREHADDVAVRELQFVDERFLEEMRRLHPDKSYRAEVACAVPVERAAVERLGALREVVMTQETPRRVLHRRPNLRRERSLRDCAVEILDAPGPVRRFALTVRAQAGTYIKEFVSGDEGRAQPSVTALLGRPCDCVALDVLDVHCDPVVELRRGAGG